MLSNEEVVLAADAIERVYATMLEIDRIAGLDSTYNTSSNILNIHNTHKEQHIAKLHDMDLVHIRSQDSGGMSSFYHKDSTNSSVSVGMYAWFQYGGIINTRKENTILKTRTNNKSSLLRTQSNSNTISFEVPGSPRTVFEFHKLGTPECDEYLFQQCLVQEDLVMNALIFQYEWRRRRGSDIQLRIGVDAVQTCLEIERVVQEAYEHFSRFRIDP